MKNLGDKISSYSTLSLERNVDQFLSMLPGFKEKPPPILSEVVLDRLPEVKSLDTLELLSKGVEAMVVTPKFMHRDLTVMVDQQILNHRDAAAYNMALAEEIGHIQLHRAVMLDIRDTDDFLDLQAHPKWQVAERDAKYWGRAMLMPRYLLEREARENYERLAVELGFADSFHFSQVFIAHLAAIFQIPPADAQRRIDGYVGDLRGRLDKSIAARTDYLLDMSDSVRVSLRQSTELSDVQLFGTALRPVNLQPRK